MLCPECQADIYQLEDSLLHSPIDSEDFWLACYIIGNCNTCERLVRDLLQERADIMAEVEEIIRGYGRS